MKQRDYLSEYQFVVTIQGATNGVMINHTDTAGNLLTQTASVCTTKEEAIELITKQLEFFYKD